MALTTVTMMRLMTMSQKTLSILAEWGTQATRAEPAPRSQQWALTMEMTGSGTGTMASTRREAQAREAWARPEARVQEPWALAETGCVAL
jgi:hypothetical protein